MRPIPIVISVSNQKHYLFRIPIVQGNKCGSEKRNIFNHIWTIDSHQKHAKGLAYQGNMLQHRL